MDVDETNEVIPVFTCPRCRQVSTPHHIDKHICVDCSKAESNRIVHFRQHQGDWMQAAREQGLDVWLLQPNETQWEYTIWTAYRDSYPGKKPTYSGVAEQLGTSAAAVRKVAQRWSFPMRMQAWITYTNELTMLQRRNEIIDMNKEHIDMATRLRGKISEAIDAIDIDTMKPSEISSLFKLAAELERKARIDTIAQDEIRGDIARATDNPELKKTKTKVADMESIIGILVKSGALGDVKQIGVRQTTEIAVKGSNNNSASMILDDSEDD